MKRILCLIDGLGSGGAQRQMSGLSALLKESGYQVTLAYYHEPNFYKEWLEVKGISAVKLQQNQGRLSKIFSVLKLIKECHFDVVIAYMEGPAVICCILRLLGTIKRLIVSERNVTQTITHTEKIRFGLYRFADVVVPNSYTQANFIESNFPFLKNKNRTITNFVDTDLFSPTEHCYRLDKMTHFLVVARINAQKNIPSFLLSIKKALQHNQDFRVDWYGDYDKANNGEVLYRQMEVLKNELGLSNYVYFHPANKNIVEIYRNCDVFCLPSLFEGFPNVLCEAMCCGKPVICSDVCDNRIIVSEGVNGFLFNPRDVESIASVILKMCNMHTDYLERMGQCSRQLSVDKFSSNVFLKKYIDLL